MRPSSSGPTVTVDGIGKTDAKSQHPVAYLEHRRSQGAERDLQMEQNLPFDIDALLVFGKVVENRSLSKAAALLGYAEVDGQPQADEAGIRPRHQAAAQEHASAHRDGPRREDLQPRREHPRRGQRRSRAGGRQQARAAGRTEGCDTRVRRHRLRVEGSGPRFCTAIPIRAWTSGWWTTWSTRSRTDSTWFSEPVRCRIRRLIARKVFSLELFLCASPDFMRQLHGADHRRRRN